MLTWGPAKAGLGGQRLLRGERRPWSVQVPVLHGCSCHVTHSRHSQGRAQCHRALQLSLESRACGCRNLALMSPSGGASFKENGPRLSSAHQCSVLLSSRLHVGSVSNPGCPVCVESQLVNLAWPPCLQRQHRQVPRGSARSAMLKISMQKA